VIQLLYSSSRHCWILNGWNRSSLQVVACGIGPGAKQRAFNRLLNYIRSFEPEIEFGQASPDVWMEIWDIDKTSTTPHESAKTESRATRGKYHPYHQRCTPPTIFPQGTQDRSGVKGMEGHRPEHRSSLLQMQEPSK
jgi:hypothetical protein